LRDTAFTCNGWHIATAEGASHALFGANRSSAAWLVRNR
jgi:hypothetical protein